MMRRESKMLEKRALVQKNRDILSGKREPSPELMSEENNDGGSTYRLKDKRRSKGRKEDKEPLVEPPKRIGFDYLEA